MFTALRSVVVCAAPDNVTCGRSVIPEPPNTPVSARENVVAGFDVIDPALLRLPPFTPRSCWISNVAPPATCMLPATVNEEPLATVNVPLLSHTALETVTGLVLV